MTETFFRKGRKDGERMDHPFYSQLSTAKNTLRSILDHNSYSDCFHVAVKERIELMRVVLIIKHFL